MNGHVLITGGAGFIGTHVADELLTAGYAVRVLDTLDPQVHGRHRRLPKYLDPRCELLVGDVRDADAVRGALKGVDAVVHLATGGSVGPAWERLEHLCSLNIGGTSVLLQALAAQPVQRLVVASSMSIYGEGICCDARGRMVETAQRRQADLDRGRWELRTAEGRPLDPLPTPETKRPALDSIDAITQFTAERLSLLMGESLHIPTTALRLFNVYGPRQGVGSGRPGVLAAFTARYLQDRPPAIFEDGRQLRDFVNVLDVARAFRLALECPPAAGQVFNIGSGRTFTMQQAAERTGAALGKNHIRPLVTGRHRPGDVRHCFADITRARAVLGYSPQVPFREGLKAFVASYCEQLADAEFAADSGAEVAA